MGARPDRETYGALVRERCLSDIERLTRFDTSSVTAIPNDVALVTVAIEEMVRVSIGVSHHTNQGRSGGNGPSARNRSDFQSLVAAEREEARLNEGLTRTVLDTASSATYGDLGDNWNLGAHGRTVRHTYSCGGCNGHGEVNCTTCGQTGRVRCSFCGGRQRIRCNSCGGTGGTITRYQDGREDRHTCIFCHGAGEQNCSTCMTGWVTCSSCNGRGKITCSTCGGQREMTDVASFSRTAVLERRLASLSPASDRVRTVVLDRQGLKAFGQLAAERTAEWLSRPGEVRGLTTLRTHCCGVDVRAGAEDFHIFALGDEGQIWDYDGLFEHLLGADLTALETAASGVLVLRRSGDPAMEEAIALFCESEAHQELLVVAGRSLGWPETATALNGTVSPAYIERSCQALSRYLGRLTLRQMGLCGLIGLPIGLVIGLIAGAALYFTERVLFFSHGEWLATLPPIGLLIGLIVGWIRAGMAFVRLGGQPAKAFMRRKGLGLFGRVLAALRKPAPADQALAAEPDEIDDEALARQSVS